MISCSDLRRTFNDQRKVFDKRKTSCNSHDGKILVNFAELLHTFGINQKQMKKTRIKLPHGTLKKIAEELGTTGAYVTQVLGDDLIDSELAVNIRSLAQACVDSRKVGPDAKDRRLAKKILNG